MSLASVKTVPFTTVALPYGVLDHRSQPPACVARFASATQARVFYKHLQRLDSGNFNRYEVFNLLPFQQPSEVNR